MELSLGTGHPPRRVGEPGDARPPEVCGRPARGSQARGAKANDGPARERKASSRQEGLRWQLLVESKRAIAGILKESKASQGKLDPKNKKQAPFFSGLQELQGAVADREKRLKAKDKTVFVALAEGSKALAKVKTAWPRVGVANAKVDGYLSNKIAAAQQRPGKRRASKSSRPTP